MSPSFEKPSLGLDATSEERTGQPDSSEEWTSPPDEEITSSREEQTEDAEEESAAPLDPEASMRSEATEHTPQASSQLSETSEVTHPAESMSPPGPPDAEIADSMELESLPDEEDAASPRDEDAASAGEQVSPPHAISGDVVVDTKPKVVEPPKRTRESSEERHKRMGFLPRDNTGRPQNRPMDQQRRSPVPTPQRAGMVTRSVTIPVERPSHAVDSKPMRPRETDAERRARLGFTPKL